MPDGSALRHVEELPGALVSIETVASLGNADAIGEPHPVDEVDIEVAITVVIEQSSAAAERAHDVMLVDISADVHEADAASRAHLAEAEQSRYDQQSPRHSLICYHWVKCL